MNYKDRVELVYGTMRRCLALTAQRDYDAALALMDEILSHELEHDLEAEALGFRASLKEDLGDYQHARDDLLAALSVSEEGSYMRYTFELSLGGISEGLGRTDEATSWYRKALLTCINTEGISGGTVLKKILKLNGEDRLSDEDRTLCEQVAMKSWKLLKLPAEPNLSNLGEAAESLIAAGGSKR